MVEGCPIGVILILCCCMSTTGLVEGSSGAGANISAILNSFQVGYDRRVRPNYGGEPVTVGVTLFILSIEDLSEKFMDFTFDMYFRQFWQDHRLSFEARPNLDKLVVGAEYIKLIWVPDTFFVNEKVALFHQATTENQFLRIMSTGDILRSMRLTIKATCPMDLSNFPMDSQTCTVEIESFGYTMTDLRYKWNDGAKSVQMQNTVSLPQFLVLGHKQRIIEASLSSGNYSRLLADVAFVRSMGYYIIQVYIPSSLIVVMSWVSFWLNRGAAPARVGLGVTTVLTMTTLMASVNAALPKISYMKSIDIYLEVCFFMVFGALIEYAMVGYTDKRIQLRKNRFLSMQKVLEEKRQEAVKQIEIQNALETAELIKITNSNPYIRTPRNERYQREASVRFHTCCMMTCTLNGGHEHHDTLPRNGKEDDSRQQLQIQLPPPLPPAQPPNRVLGMRASDIDKYSRVIFPIMFLTFHLMYWMIYLSISGEVPEDLVYLEKE
ncbi:gamma-aminobutyric acid receptor subunit beta [Eurytemora carolleeae]|uniref:gamma-aminobutyric acid receptor subunit beta n=1 Tax=Eurytemora carolleeae TaxID=1294199 RepID=UPI000C7703DE|nr:gamma-aminobutyric acid receptor subunit beta [Eurytemora carolleeae]|eukprot:XP_023343634.1 gamma-aminobutyric acid receptor subunit beta-like [Eurytemora affinis]